MRIALLGMGTVGSGVYEMLKDRADMTIGRILDRRHLGEAEALRTERFEDILEDAQIDTVVELMGGVEPAHGFAVRTLRAGKRLVSANKLMISAGFGELIAAARTTGAQMRISASVGGGIPYLANLLRARRVDEIVEISGIVNGTTNFILDAMQRDGADFAEALGQAQRAGYAEADPSADIDGLDARCKLAISASTAFDALVDPESVATAGIRAIRAADVENFQKLGLACRLIARAARTDSGIVAYVEPTLVAPGTPEAAVHGSGNLIGFRGRRAGAQSFCGPGAGKLPTAYAVVEDLTDLLAGAPCAPYVTNEAPVRANNASEAHRYYARTCTALPMPAERIGQDAFLTRPVSVQEMHAAMEALRAEDAQAFFAGIRES